MDYQTWIDNIDGMAGIYSFDIMPDGSRSEIRLMAVNQQNKYILHMRPDAPEFYPGIPYKNYWYDINFENYVYKCATNNKPLYAYVNAHGSWLKGFYIPISEPGTVFRDIAANVKDGEKRTVYCLYIVTFSQEVDADSMVQRSPEASSAIMNLSIKLHHSQGYYPAMADTMEEIRSLCGAEKCSLYTVDKDRQYCELIDETGIQPEFLEHMTAGMGRTPYENALEWEKDLARSDSLLLNDLSVIKARDPEWHRSMTSFGIRNIILYAVKFNQQIIGFIWAINFNEEKSMLIKEILELATFLLGAVIYNHQVVSKLEMMNRIDTLTQVGSRNAMNERVDKLMSGEVESPEVMGVAFVDLNGLKTVNDVEGHDAGDKLLSKGASLLKIAFADHEIYRAGGDEFVILCPGITEEKLESQVAQLRALMENTPDVSFAIGTSYFTGDYDICFAMQAADEKMFIDKEEYYRIHPDKDRRRHIEDK